jgi:hypothetical protein
MIASQRLFRVTAEPPGHVLILSIDMQFRIDIGNVCLKLLYIAFIYISDYHIQM